MLREPAVSELDALLRRDHTLHGGTLFGLDGFVVEIQARAVEKLKRPQPWKNCAKLSGMARGAINESLDRISGAFSKLAIPQPSVEILINLAPADLPKEGTWLDLPLAIIMLQSAGFLPDLHESFEGQYILLGEVGLHGEIRKVPGVLSIAHVAKAGQVIICPAGNEKECALILAKPGHEGCKICPVERLEQVIEFFCGKKKLENALKAGIKYEHFSNDGLDFARIKGQEKAKEGALIAAAGGHNLLLVGPPGEGKSLIAKALPSILPKLTNEEMVQITRIYSACGELIEDGLVITHRPMRTVHHSASKERIVGGGAGVPRPGEITLSHLGVLFLDEFAEFSESTLNQLRQPLEDGKITISRVKASIEFPSQFTLVAAMNPCPCGYLGGERCNCAPTDVKRYQKKISGPILDRIDLHVEIQPLSVDERLSQADGVNSSELRKRVHLARARQEKRFSGRGIPFNAAIPGGYILDYCQFSDSGLDAYKEVLNSSHLTTRSSDRLAKVARTVADLYNSDSIDASHVKRAASFISGGKLQGCF